MLYCHLHQHQPALDSGEPAQRAAWQSQPHGKGFRKGYSFLTTRARGGQEVGRDAWGTVGAPQEQLGPAKMSWDHVLSPWPACYHRKHKLCLHGDPVKFIKFNFGHLLPAVRSLMNTPFPQLKFQEKPLVPRHDHTDSCREHSINCTK